MDKRSQKSNKGSRKDGKSLGTKETLKAFHDLEKLRPLTPQELAVKESLEGELKPRKKVEWYHPTLNPYGPLRPGQTEWVPGEPQATLKKPKRELEKELVHISTTSPKAQSVNVTLKEEDISLLTIPDGIAPENDATIYHTLDFPETLIEPPRRKEDASVPSVTVSQNSKAVGQVAPFPPLLVPGHAPQPIQQPVPYVPIISAAPQMRDLYKDLKGMIPHSIRNKQRKRPIDSISSGHEENRQDKEENDMDAEYASFMAEIE